MGHGKSAEWMQNNAVPNDVKVIDLSSDFRAAGPSNPFQYGLPEKYRREIALSTRIANPGCLATATELALLPISEKGLAGSNIVVHAITGSTGAGQQPIDTTHYSWRDSNVSTYKVFEHQHEAEILQTLGSIALHFIPMRGPFTRGILATAVIPGTWNAQDVHDLYVQRYADHPFIAVRETLPDMKPVVNTNMCHIGIATSASALMVVSVIDNLMKGAAGQAVQNMNIMFGCDERAGLLVKPSAF
jgi:N-acetyl-gamma-glutamyl-phosphate reductase